jgi:TolA-binding protein
VLADPSLALRCTLLASTANRIACLSEHRARFPDSPRAAATLARLATLHAASNCAAAATPLLAEYLDRFPEGPDARTIRAWRDQCAHAHPIVP